MSVSKDEVKSFKTAKKNIEREYDVQVVRREDIVEVDGVYSFSFGENEKAMSHVEMETEMSNTIMKHLAVAN